MGKGIIGAINEAYAALFCNPPEKTGGLPFYSYPDFQKIGQLGDASGGGICHNDSGEKRSLIS